MASGARTTGAPTRCRWAKCTKSPSTCKILEKWMKSYKPDGAVRQKRPIEPELADLPPKGNRRMSANPHANGGLLLRDLRLPDFRDYAVK